MNNLIAIALTCALISCSSSVEVKPDKQVPSSPSRGTPQVASANAPLVTVEYAQSVIDRAKVLLHHLPSANSKMLYTEALDRMKVYMTDSSLVVDRNSDDYKFSLIIVDRTLQIASRWDDGRHVTPFSFNWDKFDTTGEVIIDMDVRLRDYGQDIDAIAAGLLHELMHAGEANDHKGKPRPPIFESEMNGWLTQVYVYFSEHMDIAESVASCDCQTMQITMKKGPVPKDIFLYSMIQFQFCKEEFLHQTYGY